MFEEIYKIYKINNLHSIVIDLKYYNLINQAIQLNPKLDRDLLLCNDNAPHTHCHSMIPPLKALLFN